MLIDKTNTVESRNYNRIGLLVPAAIGFIGVIIVLIGTHKFGAGISADSASYIAAARSLLAGKGFLKFDGTVFDSWPPLYSTLLAAFKLCGVDYFISARCISSVSFGLLIYLSGFWVLKRSGSLLLSLLSSVSILFSKPVFEVSFWAWSEPLFLLLTATFLCLMFRVLEKPTAKWVLSLALITAATCLTRYIGVVLLPLGGLLLLANKKQMIWKRLALAVFWGVISILPIALWMQRNWGLTGTPMGARYPASIPLSKNITLMGEVIASWFLPTNVIEIIPGWILFCLFCVLVVAILVFDIRKTRKSKLYWMDAPSIPMVLFLIIYSLAILSSATRVIMDSLDDRFLAPLYLPMVLAFWAGPATVIVLPRSTQPQKQFHSRFVKSGLAVGIIIGIWFSAGSNFVFARTQNAYRDGAGGRSRSYWHNSPTIAWLRSHPLKGRIFSNDPISIYILADCAAAMSPSSLETFDNPTPMLREKNHREISDFESAVQSEPGAYLVWFLIQDRKYLYKPNQLADFCQMSLVEKLQDGYILALYPKDLHR